MQRTINTYKGLMIDKILHCKTHFEVLSIIDRKVTLITKTNGYKAIVKQFLDKSLINLKNLPEESIKADQWSKIRVAISHLENLKMHYSH